MNTKLETQKAPKAFRTISEVAGELDLQPYVIRFWESQFKQIKPMRKRQQCIDSKNLSLLVVQEHVPCETSHNFV